MELNATNNNSLNNQESQGQENSTGTEETTEQTTFTREEVLAMIQKESDKRVSQALATQERKNAAKLREAEKLANMSAEEKFRYELDQREAAIAEKEHQLLLAENRAEAGKILADKGLSLSFVDFVLDDTAEAMNEKINTIEKAFKASVRAEVEKRLGTNPPKSATTTPKTMTREQFAKLPLKEQQEIAKNDRELYNSLIYN